MRRALHIVALALCAACERKAVTPAVSDPPSNESCVADELGPLKPGWKVLGDCETDTDECRTRCRDGDADACFNRAILKQNAHGAESEITQLFLGACKLGLGTGCTNWAAASWTKARGSSAACLYRVFEKTCAIGDPFGCGMLGRMLIENGTSPVDLVRGRVFLSLACAQNPITCTLLAIYLEKDTFGPPNHAKAAELRQQACEAGDDSECVDVGSNADDRAED